MIAYRDLLRGEIDFAEKLGQYVSEPCILRIESPGEDHEVERRLIARGARAGDISPSAALRLRFDKGRLRFARQWFAGWTDLLDEVEQFLVQLEAAEPIGVRAAT